MERFRHLIIALLLLLYVGQSLAAVVVPCFTMGSAPGEISDPMASMDHSDYHMASLQPAAAGSESCCDNNGSLCSMSQCQAVVALTVATSPGADSYAAIHNDATLFSVLNVSFASLYRPPISC